MRMTFFLLIVSFVMVIGSCIVAGGDVSHPVYKYAEYGDDDIPGLMSSVDYLMSLPGNELLALVPDQAGLYFVRCPNCEGGRQDNTKFLWTPKSPDEIKCPHCGHVYPSDEYPMEQSVKVEAPSGKTVEYPYWENADGKRYYFEAKRDFIAREWLSERTFNLALLYHLTGESKYARRAALIINRFAEVFPDYVYKFDYPFRPVEWYEEDVAAEDFRAGFRTSRWDWWAYMDIPVQLVRAYDLIYKSGEINDIEGAKERIEQQFFLDAAEQVAANEDNLGNMSPVAWRAMVVVGRVLQQPEYVHEVVQRLEQFTARRFYYDGAWKEGAPSYHRQVIGGLDRLFDVIEGYSDPDGYTTETGERFENLNLREDVPVVSRTISALQKMCLPNGRLAPVHDTWARNRYKSRDESEPVLLPALGHAILGRGEGDQQRQVHLTWSGGYGHIHYDGLSMLAFANGTEYLSDVGYTHTKFRPWTLATASHNAVVVDYENQYAGSNPQSDGALVFFDGQSPDTQVVVASNPQVYPDLVDRYERTLATVATGENSGYMVDCFIVSGGSQHDYFLHGSADDAQTIVLDEDLTTTPVETMMPEGTNWTPPEGEHHSGWARDRAYAYGFLRDTVVSQPNAGIETVAFDFDESDLSTRIFTVTEEGDELFTGGNPQIRHAQNDDRAVVSFERPYMMLRRTPEDDSSRFVSVIESTGGAPVIESVSVIETEGDGVAVAVAAGNFTDIVGIGADGLTGQFMGQGFSMDGPLCRIRVSSDGRPTGGYAAGRAEYGDLLIDAGEPRQAPLVDVERGEEGGALIVGADWSDPAPSAGTVIVLDHGDGYSHGYHVASTEAADGATKIRTVEDPGFSFDAESRTVSYQYFPHSTHTGENVVRWIGAASVQRSH